VRSSSAPGFLVIKTARLGPHSKGDDTRSAEAIAALHARDPLAQLGHRLAASDKLAIDAANARFLDAVERAAVEAAPANYDTVPRHMFADHATTFATPRAATPAATVRSSLNAALRRLLASDPRVVLLGEDLADPYGGAFKVTAGLSTAFPERVVSTPISEAAIVGAGVGLAMAGGRPVVEIMFADFLTLAIDQLLNHAVKFAGIFPDTSVPLVVRTPSGGHRGYGPTHSQSTETLAAAIPGLTVVVPSHRHDPGLLLETAVREWPHPTVFFENKILYGLSCDQGEYFDAAADLRDPAAALFPTLVSGVGAADVTLVTYGGALPGVEAAAIRLEAEELTVRIIALSLIAPLPCCTLTTLLRDAPLVVVVEESATTHGVGAELGAVLLEAGFRGRFARIGAPPIPIPAARGLERAVLPGDDRIVADVSRLARGLSVVC
jgi:2-oxoisovalerate dehydrogenase E1 component